MGMREYILIMLAMKGRGKSVTAEHILGKAGRDFGDARLDDIEKILDALVNETLVFHKKGEYGATENALNHLTKEFSKNPDFARGINPTYVMKFKASKMYYPSIGPSLLPLFKERAVGMYRVFTDKQFFQRNFGGRWVTIESMEELLYWVDAHGTDLIPYVHKIKSPDFPDWLVIDVDAEKGFFEDAKRACLFVHDFLKKQGLEPLVKFSGSRGFHLWVQLEKVPLPEGEKSYFTFYTGAIGKIQEKMFSEIPGLRNKLKLDPASMKPWGLVRAPYSIHHSPPFLTSLPLEVGDVERFRAGQATIDAALARFRERGFEWELETQSPEKLFKALF